MALARFDASRLKVKRARHHMGALMEDIRVYLLRTPFYLEIVAEPTQDKKGCVIHVREEVPNGFSAIQFITCVPRLTFWPANSCGSMGIEMMMWHFHSRNPLPILSMR
jgi:hypothetical protein